MSFYQKLSRNKKTFLNCTGMTLESFEPLYPTLEQKYAENEEVRKSRTVLSREKRQRGIGGGRQFGNDFKDRVLMLLMYYRLYLTQEFMTLLFKAQNKSVISRSIKSVKHLEAEATDCVNTRWLYHLSRE